MTLDAEAPPDPYPGAQDSDAEARADAEFKDQLAKMGMRRVDAYVRDARKKGNVSQAAKDKRAYRAQRKAEGIGQYVVEVPEDEDAKRAVYAVAKAIIDDKADSNNVRSIIVSVASNPDMLDLVYLLSAAEADVSSLIEMTKSGTLNKLAAIRATHPTLLDHLSELAKSNDKFLSVVDCLCRHGTSISHGSAAGLLEASVLASECLDTLSFIKVRQRGGLRARLLGWLLGMH